VIADAFKSLDKGNKGNFTQEDIRAFLTTRYMFCSDPEIANAFQRFDKLGCGTVSLEEFTREMAPKIL